MPIYNKANKSHLTFIIGLFFLTLCFHTSFSQDVFENPKTEKQGIKDGNKVLIKAKYDNLEIIDTNRVIAKKDTLYGLIDFNENIILPFTEYYLYDQNKHDKKRIFFYGKTRILYDFDGNVILEDTCPAEHGRHFDLNGIVGVQNGKYGAYDADGKVLIPFKYQRLIPSSYCVIPYQLNDKWGIFSETGELVTEPIYDSITDVGLWDVYIKLNGKYGSISCDGNTLLKPIYEKKIEGWEFNYAGLGTAWKNGKMGVINKLGEEKSEFIYDDIEGFLNWKYDTILRVTIDGKKGTITPSGVKLIPPIYSSYYRYHKDNNIYFVTKDHEFHGAVYYDGTVMIPPVFEEFYTKKKYKPYFRVMRDGNVGLINLKGEYKQRFDTDVIRPMPNLPNGAKIDGFYEFGIIDSARNVIVPRKFNKIKFYNGKYGVAREGFMYSIIDSVGNHIIKREFDRVLDLKDSLLIVRQDGIYRLVTVSGTEYYSGSNKLVPYAANLYLEIGKDETRIRNSKGEYVDFERTEWDFSYPLLVIDTEGEQPNVIMREQPTKREDPNKRYKLVNIDNGHISPNTYERIQYHINKPTHFLREKNWYTLNEDFEERLVIDVRSIDVTCEYDYLELITTVRADVNYYYAGKNGKHGVIDYYNNIVIPFIYDKVYSFHTYDRCAVLNGKYGVLNHKNDVIVDFKYDSIISSGTYLGPCCDFCPEGDENDIRYFVVKKDGKYAIFRNDSTVLTDFIYEDFESSHKWPSAIFKRNDEWYVVKEDGSEHIKPGVVSRILIWDGNPVDCWEWVDDVELEFRDYE